MHKHHHLLLFCSISVPDEPPNNVTGFHTNGHSMQIHWNQIQFQFRNSYVLKYYIFYQKVNSTEPEKFFVCSKTSYLPSSCEMTELEYQTAYFVSVAGVSSEGIGRKSKAIIVSTGPYGKRNHILFSKFLSRTFNFLCA